MTNKEIFDLIDRFEASDIQTMKLTTGDFSIELSRGGTVSTSPAAPAPKTPAPNVSKDDVITAPVVGVFYAASAPGEAPFVTVGDKVSKGQPLCLMEAMKMLSEVSAPCDCVITEVLKENGALAEYGEPLFRYRPC